MPCSGWHLLFTPDESPDSPGIQCGPQIPEPGRNREPARRFAADRRSSTSVERLLACSFRLRSLLLLSCSRERRTCSQQLGAAPPSACRAAEGRQSVEATRRITRRTPEPWTAAASSVAPCEAAARAAIALAARRSHATRRHGGHRLAPPYYLGSTGYYISATPPPNIMTAARGHRKPSRASANVKGGEIASVLPGEYRVLNFST